jgi:hypothetical protein
MHMCVFLFFFASYNVISMCDFDILLVKFMCFFDILLVNFMCAFFNILLVNIYVCFWYFAS